jgi:predicted dehydrogenase
MENAIVLVGTGPMAIDYAHALIARSKEFKVIGRGKESALKFESITGIKPFIGGLHTYLNNNKFNKNTYVIIATGTEALMPTLLLILKAGAYKVLIEKPAAISIEELIENEEKIKVFSENIFVAYNRRFYASVIEAQRMIEEDGGLKTIHFEFTEWAHKIEPLTKASGVKENWFFANSTHVVDLAFYLAGKPIDWKAFSKAGSLKWHSKVNFTGAGITDKGVLFSYISNWESAGRWAIELLTDKRRIYLKPMEKISIQQKGSVTLADYAFDDSLDTQFKPGLMLQVAAFLTNHDDKLLNIKGHVLNSKNIYSKIIN